MLNPRTIFSIFKRKGVRFFTGVPDSLLKHFCAYVTAHADPRAHVIAANEGNAVALAAGHYLATGAVPLVYMQNSGLGNAVNPLVSLVDAGVYSIPMILVIGWRGAPNSNDEPQHRIQGSLTLPFLKTLRIPSVILPTDESEAADTIARLYDRAVKEKRAVAIVVREGTFGPFTEKQKNEKELPLSREDALRQIVPLLPKDAVVISTTGKLSRELFELRKEVGDTHERDFLTVGSMGHASQIALGVALAQKKRPIYCFDGDGAALMHLGGWSVIGHMRPKNLKHVVFNNGAHDSVGGQPTAGFSTDFTSVAKACGYTHAVSVLNAVQLRKAFLRLREEAGPSLLEICIRKGSRDTLGRPTRAPVENKDDLMKFLNRK